VRGQHATPSIFLYFGLQVEFFRDSLAGSGPTAALLAVLRLPRHARRCPEASPPSSARVIGTILPAAEQSARNDELAPTVAGPRRVEPSMSIPIPRTAKCPGMASSGSTRPLLV
jgi:hypothetical protein